VTALLDLNVFVALVWPTHEHHAAAHSWLRARGQQRWASCPVTELGFVRILSNPAFSSDALKPADAFALLVRNTAHPRHEFWPDTLSVSRGLKTLLAGIAGHRQITDAYLLALAAHRKGLLATFDKGLSQLAAEVGLESNLDLVATR